MSGDEVWDFSKIFTGNSSVQLKQNHFLDQCSCTCALDSPEDLMKILMPGSYHQSIYFMGDGGGNRALAPVLG